MKPLGKLFSLSSADEIDAANAKAAPPDPARRPGVQAPLSLAESLVHAAGDAALDRLNAVLGVPPGVRDSFLKGPDGAVLRNALRRYVMHANSSAMEAEK